MIAQPTLAMRAYMFPAHLTLATQAYPIWSLAVQQAGPAVRRDRRPDSPAGVPSCIPQGVRVPWIDEG